MDDSLYERILAAKDKPIKTVRAAKLSKDERSLYRICRKVTSDGTRLMFEGKMFARRSEVEAIL